MVPVEERCSVEVLVGSGLADTEGSTASSLLVLPSGPDVVAEEVEMTSDEEPAEESVVSDDETAVSPVTSVVSPSPNVTVVVDGSSVLIDSFADEGAAVVELLPVNSGMPVDSRANGVVSVVFCSAVVSAVSRVEPEVDSSLLDSVADPEVVDVISEDSVTVASLIGKPVDPETTDGVLSVLSGTGPLVDTVE